MSKQEHDTAEGNGTSAAADVMPTHALARRARKAPDLIRINLHRRKHWVTEKKAMQVARALIKAVAEPTPTSAPTLAERRKNAGFTQEQAANAVGISRTYLSKIERGKAENLTLRIAQKIARLYDCTVNSLNV